MEREERNRLRECGRDRNTEIIHRMRQRINRDRVRDRDKRKLELKRS